MGGGNPVWVYPCWESHWDDGGGDAGAAPRNYELSSAPLQAE